MSRAVPTCAFACKLSEATAKAAAAFTPRPNLPKRATPTQVFQSQSK